MGATYRSRIGTAGVITWTRKGCLFQALLKKTQMRDAVGGERVCFTNGGRLYDIDDIDDWQDG
jgi:hypothetical protein